MIWLLLGTLVWVALAVPAALVIARGIRVADAARAADAEAQAVEANFVASETPPAEAPLPWTGPATVPFPPPASGVRPRPRVVHEPVSRTDGDSAARDSGRY